jgi:hypothetical protein
LFLVSIARVTARRIYHGRPWLSDVGHLKGVLPLGSLRGQAVARVGVSDDARKDERSPEQKAGNDGAIPRALP